jgi:DUF4097 and DUF4098 domain-containing protein YvlB
MMKTLGRLALLAMLCVCVSWMGCGDDNGVGAGGNVDNTNFKAEETFYFVVDVIAQSLLEIEAVNGTITIEGVSESDSITISGTRRVRSESIEDAEEHLDDLEVSVQHLTGEVFIETIQPSQSHGRSYEVDYEITLPEHLEVLVKSVNGNIIIDSIENDVSVANVNGGITLEEILGSVSAALVNGEIEGMMTLPPGGAIELAVVNGTIALSIPQSTSAELTARVTVGTVSVSNLVIDYTHNIPTWVSGTLGTGQGTVSLAVTNGIISVIGF